MNATKKCARCGEKFREPPSEPFLTCPKCRKPDVLEHKQERKPIEERPEDLDEFEVDWDGIHRAYEDSL